MNTNRFVRKLLLFLLFVILIGCTLACSEQPAGPRAWIDFPVDQSTVPVGAPVAVLSHAFARDGIAEIVLSVDGEPLRRNPPAQPGETFSKVSHEWVPQQQGEYLLQIKVYSKTGETSTSASSRVRVIGTITPTPTLPRAQANITPVTGSITPTPPPGLSDLAIVSVEALFVGYKGDVALCRPRVVYRNLGTVPVPSDYVIQLHVNGTPQMTMTRGAGFGVGGTSEAIFDYTFEGTPYIGINLDSTNAVSESSETNNAFAEARRCSGAAAPITPTYTPTIPPPLPSTCSGTPSIASFAASPSTITAGQSTTLSWGTVTNADSVTIDPGIGGVAAPGSRSVSPGTTTTYTLTARCGSNTLTRQATVTVLPLAQVITPTRTRTPVPDTQGPPAPNIVSPKGTLTSCRTSVTLDWNAVSDPSGIKNYIVKWQLDDGKTGGTVTTSTQHTISLTCDTKSHTHTWSVQAEDNAGNLGATSSTSFTNPAILY